MNDQVEQAGRVALRTGRVFGGLFCLVFALVGFAAALFLGREVWRDVRPHFWKSVDCTILHSESGSTGDRKGGPYTLTVRYEYQWDGRTLSSDRIHPGRKSYSDYEDVQRRLDRYRVGAKAVCQVNPSKPEEAVLEKPWPWSALFMAIPLVFIVVGAVGFHGAMFGRTHGQSRPAKETPVSSRARRSGQGAGCLFLFFLVFFVAGSGFLYVVLIRPMLKSQEARSWTELPCEIVSSQVTRHSDSDGTTYGVDILYEYRVNGRTYRSNRYGFLKSSSSGRSAKEAIVRRYPARKQTVCYVNPADPAEAVLHRGLPEEKVLMFVPLIFVAIGLGGMIYAVRARKGARPSEARIRPVDLEPAGPVMLRATYGRVGKVIATFLFAAFWNGIVSVFVVQLIRGAQRSSFDWFLALFLVPFVLIGLVVIGFFGYCFLGLFAPRAVLTLSARDIRLGEPVELTWRFSGRAHVIEKLRIYLEGAEVASYRQGTRTLTDRSVFAEVDVADTVDGTAIRSGHARMAVPEDMVPSFDAPSNKIVWTLRVKGVIGLYPDINDEFTIRVLPRPVRKEVA